MELVHLLVKEDLVGGLEHLVVDAVHLITGLHGLELAEAAEMVCMELLAEAVEEDLLVVEVLVAVALEDHKQLITAVPKAGMEQVQAEAEITAQVETAKREVLA
jgi:hypothetical protein